MLLYVMKSFPLPVLSVQWCWWPYVFMDKLQCSMKRTVYAVKSIYLSSKTELI